LIIKILVSQVCYGLNVFRRPLSAHFPDVIYYLVLEDAKEPGLNRGTARETVLAPDSSQKGLLDKVLSYLTVMNSEQGITKERIAVLVYPGLGIEIMVLFHF
jgi:hypothetical protein